MNILYGVAGEGFGHSSRARVIADYLERKGHKVLILTYGQGYEALKDKFDVFRVKGLHLIFEKSVLSRKKTFLFNLKHFTKNFLRWKRFYKMMGEFKPNLCISDMEPIVPVLSNWYSLPLLCIDNQHRITNLKIKVPKKYYRDYLTAKAVTNAFVSRADWYIVTSFAETKIIKKNTFIVPPIIKEEVKKLKAGNRENILVYLTKKDKGVLRILKNIKERFVIYGFNLRKKEENLKFKTKENFLQDLENCRAVIATSGFTLISEALYLKKPYFALPLKGQFEQVLNALFLKQAGFGEYSEDLKEEDIKRFLENLEVYKKKLGKYKPDYNKLYEILDKTLKKVEKS